MENTVNKKASFSDNKTLIKEYRAGNREAGEELCALNYPLVYRIAGRFSGRGIDMEDLVQIGNIGLVKAINTFDFSRECAFSTYAVPLIFGEIRRFLRDDGMIKVSRDEKRLCALLNAERDRRKNTGEDTRISALASAIGVSREDAASAISAGYGVRSLEEKCQDDDDLTIGSTVYDTEEQKRNFEHLSLHLALEKLPVLERRIILLRYFRDKSQSETAALLGITQVKVSRIEKRIMETLRRELV